MVSSLIAQIAQTAPTLAKQSGAVRNQALLSMAQSLGKAKAKLLQANEQDLAQASGLAKALKDRLTLGESGIDKMIESLHQIAELPDPIGNIRDLVVRPQGFQLGRMRVPLGVVGMIYESRPNVTQEAAALCLKSGNACVLRGGSEAFHSNTAIIQAIHQGLESVGLPKNCVGFIPTTDRSAVDAMLVSPHIDVLIPRGGKSLIEKVSATAQMPVIKHLDGNCHLFVDDSADLDMAVRLADNAKTQRYGTCNTIETLLVHEKIAAAFLPKIADIYHRKGVEMRACERTRAIIGNTQAATEEDWWREYLAPIIAIRVVVNIQEAIDHINHYGSHHTDAIVSENYSYAQKFLREVDSASVLVNASPRLADGFEYGLGAEIGISTDKFHARGPVGLEGLTSEKWVVLGHGEVRH